MKTWSLTARLNAVLILVLLASLVVAAGGIAIALDLRGALVQGTAADETVQLTRTISTLANDLWNEEVAAAASTRPATAAGPTEALDHAIAKLEQTAPASARAN